METRATHPRMLIAPVVFALVCAVVTIVTWQAFGGSLPFQATGYQVTVPLPEATNIYPGSGVEIAGVKVGKVAAVRRVGNGAQVTLELDKKYAPLRTGAMAITRTKTLLGEGYVELAPGPRAAAPIPDGGRLSASHVLPAQQLEQFLQTFAPTTRQKIRSMFTGLARAFGGQAGNVSNDLASAAPATESLTAVVQTLAGQSGEVQRLIANSGDVLGAMGEREGALQAVVNSGNELFAATARRNLALSTTIRALPPFLHQLRSTSAVLGAASGDLRLAVDALEPDAPELAPALQAVDQATPEFQALFQQLPGLIRAGRRGLPAIQQIVRATGVAFKQVYPAARQLIPLMQLTGLDRDQIVAFFANVAQLSNFTYIGPGGESVRGVGAIPSIWNETVGGWVKRLPTNRMNPYPEPRSALNIASGGLRAYDCRNTGNPLYLPPIGGAPPCLLQGPWTFDGKTQYFPHLTVAPP